MWPSTHDQRLAVVFFGCITKEVGILELELTYFFNTIHIFNFILLVVVTISFCLQASSLWSSGNAHDRLASNCVFDLY